MPHPFSALFTSLKVRVAFAGGLILAIGIASTSSVLIGNAERSTLQDRRESEAAEARRSAGLLGSRLADLQGALAAVAGNFDEALMDSSENLETFLQSKPIARLQFSTLLISDSTGQVRVVYDEKGIRQVALDISDRPYFKKAMATGKPVVSDLLISRVSPEPVVILVQPLVRDGRVYGILSGGIRIKRMSLLAGVADTSSSDRSVFIAVTDRAGTLLAHPDKALVGEPVAAERRLGPLFDKWRTFGGPGALDGVDLSDDENVAVAASVPGAGPGWLIWRITRIGDVNRPLQQSRADALHWAVFCTVALAFILFALVWWLLNPLTRLEQRAERLFGPESDAGNGWPNARGEVGRLEKVLRRVSKERSVLEAENAQVFARLQSVMDTVPVGIAFVRGGRFELVSVEFCRLLNRSAPEIATLALNVVFLSRHDFDTFVSSVAARFEKRQEYTGEVLVPRVGFGPFWGRITGTPLDYDDLEAGTIWSVIDITQEVGARQALEWAAIHDPLTGLTNRKGFDQRLARVFGAPPRARPASLLVIDLDRFKPINDTHGHAAGDAMLKAVTHAALRSLRATDLLVRLGGDEFAVVLERCPPAAALHTAQTLLAAIAAAEVPWGGAVLRVGASIGVAALTDAMTATHQWVKAADEACYAAKSAGRNNVQVADAGGAYPAGSGDGA